MNPLAGLKMLLYVGRLFPGVFQGWFSLPEEWQLGGFYGKVSFCLLLLLLLSHFSRVRLCVTPSLGFSRQERWSGLPFPSPMHKSEKWKWSRSVRSDSSQPHGLQPTRLLHPWDFPGKSIGVGCHCLLRNFCLETLKNLLPDLCRSLVPLLAFPSSASFT